MKKKTFIILLLITFCASFAVYANENTSGEPFLYSYGGGTKAFMMGYSGTGDVFDTSALYLNPAGLAYIEDFEFSLNYQMIHLINYSSIMGAFGIPLGKNQALGISANYTTFALQSGNLLPFDDQVPNKGTGDSQIITHIGYGVSISEKIRLGFAAKVFNQSMKFNGGSYSRTELSVDAGMQFDLTYFLSLGFQIRNAFSYAIENDPDTKENFPMIIKPGITFKALNERLVINFDLSIPTVSASLNYHFGLSFRIAKWFTIYAGLSSGLYAGGIDLRPFEELLFYFGVAYQEMNGDNKFTDGTKTSSGITLSFGVKFLIRPPSKKVNKQVKDFLKAQKAMRKGQYGRAMEILQDIQRDDVENKDLNQLTQEYLRIAQRRSTNKDWMSKKDKDRINRYMKKGIEDYHRRKFASSIRNFVKVIDIYPAHKNANAWLAKVRSEVNREATKFYKIGESFYINGKLVKAQRALKHCLSIDPEYTPASNLLKRIAGGATVAAIREGIAPPVIRRGVIISPTGNQGTPINAGGSNRIIVNAKNENEKLFQRGESYYYEAKYIESISILRKFVARSNDEELKLKANVIISKAEQKYKQNTNARIRKRRSEELYRVGMVALQNKRYRDAIDAFLKSWVSDRTNYKARSKLLETQRQLNAKLRALLNEGVALRDQKDFDEAIIKFDMVISIDKEHELAIKALALKRATQQERKGAAQRHLAIANDALRNRQYQAALTNYNIVLKIQPNNRTAQNGRRRALRMFTGRINGLLVKGRTQLRRRNFTGAIVFFDRVLLIDKNNRAANEGKKQAKDLMERASARRSVKENMQIAQARFDNRDFELALTTINRVLSVQPRNIRALELRNKCVVQIKREKQRRRIMKFFSEGARAFRKRKYDLAIKKWTQVLKEQSKSPDFDANVIREYIRRAGQLKKEAGNIALREGDKYYRLRRYKKAKESYQEALKRNPKSDAIRLKLTRVEQQISREVRLSFKKAERAFNDGNYAVAIKEYKKILNYEQESELANTAKDELQRSEDALKNRKKGDEYMDKRNYIEAITQFEYLLAINSRDKYAQEKRRQAMVALSRRIRRIKTDAVTFLRRRNYAKAIALLKIVVKFDKDDREAAARLAQAEREAKITVARNYARGVRAYNVRNWKAALAAFNVVRGINPTYKQTNKFYRRALENYNRITAKRNAAKRGQLQALFYQGITLYRQNKLRAAIAVWRRILAVDPGNAKARQYIQRAKFRLGG